MTDTMTVEIPAEVKDNSQTVTDYAFMKHRSPGQGRLSYLSRDREIELADLFGYTLYTWHDVNQGNRQGWGAGQRCRFDMLVNRKGVVVHLFHTEYFTRVGCSHQQSTVNACEYRYADYYARIKHNDGSSTTRPLCAEHVGEARECEQDVDLSERLLIGQHD